MVNRNTIPGDKSALHPSGLRLGTPWITQRGFTEKHIDQLAAYMAQVLKACVPYSYSGRKGNLYRAKVDFDSLNDAKVKIRNLSQSVGIDFKPSKHGYPHFYYVDDKAVKSKYEGFEILGERVDEFLNWATSNDVYALKNGASQATEIRIPSGEGKHRPYECVLTRKKRNEFVLTVPAKAAARVKTWLRDLSDEYVKFDDDLYGKLPGVVIVRDGKAVKSLPRQKVRRHRRETVFIGISNPQSPSLISTLYVD